MVAEREPGLLRPLPHPAPGEVGLPVEGERVDFHVIVQVRTGQGGAGHCRGLCEPAGDVGVESGEDLLRRPPGDPAKLTRVAEYLLDRGQHLRLAVGDRLFPGPQRTAQPICSGICEYLPGRPRQRQRADDDLIDPRVQVDPLTVHPQQRRELGCPKPLRDVFGVFLLIGAVGLQQPPQRGHRGTEPQRARSLHDLQQWCRTKHQRLADRGGVLQPHREVIKIPQAQTP